jgi:hypothetical protein
MGYGKERKMKTILKRSILCSVFIAVIVGWPLYSSHAAPIFRIESAPIFADAGGANQVIGTFGTIFSETFTFGTPTNTGPLADFNANLPLNFGFDFWIKSQAGVFLAPTNQMVIQIEGASNGANGGMFDISNNIIKHDNAQAVPAGKVFYSEQLRIGVYDIAFPSAPTIQTNSRIQNYVTFGLHDPATDTLDPNSALWHNILDDNTGLTPIIQSSFDASGLDLFYEFAGSGYVFDALEDQALRLVTFFEGDLPGGNGVAVPEPATMLLLGSGLVGLVGFRKKLKK